MLARTKTSRVAAFDEAQLQMCTPARIAAWLFELLRGRHPAAPEISGVAKLWLIRRVYLGWVRNDRSSELLN
ncbi:TPA: hypothetical protein ACKP22_002272 [Pseudomonas putida]